MHEHDNQIYKVALKWRAGSTAETLIEFAADTDWGASAEEGAYDRHNNVIAIETSQPTDPAATGIGGFKVYLHDGSEETFGTFGTSDGRQDLDGPIIGLNIQKDSNYILKMRFIYDECFC